MRGPVYVHACRRSLAALAWSDERRASFLLRDVPRPIALDVGVTPLAVGDEPAFELWARVELSDDPATVLPGWDGDLGPAWDGPPDDLVSLGFDVSDHGGPSGLTNCGYEPDDRRYLAHLWGERLNEHHLFATRAEALLFCEATNERVPEHAPFDVYEVLCRAADLARLQGAPR